MRYGKKVIGATLYRRLREDVLVHINGKDVTRQMLIERFKCGNFAAVKNLAKAAHDHGIDLDHLSAFDQFEALAMVPGVGPTTLYVAMCLMSARDADKVVKQVHFVAILAELERAVAALREAVGPAETTTPAKRGLYKARGARRGPEATHVAKMKAAATRFSRRRSGTRKQAFDLNMRQAVDKLGQTKDVVTSRDIMTAMGLRETQRSILNKRLRERSAEFGLAPVAPRGTVSNRHNPKTYRITEGGA